MKIINQIKVIISRPVLWTFLGLITIYRRGISPFIPGCCRFFPSCSEYAYIALLKHGIFKGGWLACKRFFKCNPWGPSGCDPVPQKMKETN